MNQTVVRAKDELANYSTKLSKIGHARHLVREYYEENPGCILPREKSVSVLVTAHFAYSKLYMRNERQPDS